jgi:hypothetical protein
MRSTVPDRSHTVPGTVPPTTVPTVPTPLGGERYWERYWRRTGTDRSVPETGTVAAWCSDLTPTPGQEAAS